MDTLSNVDEYDEDDKKTSDYETKQEVHNIENSINPEPVSTIN